MFSVPDYGNKHFEFTRTEDIHNQSYREENHSRMTLTNKNPALRKMGRTPESEDLGQEVEYISVDANGKL